MTVTPHIEPPSPWNESIAVPAGEYLLSPDLGGKRLISSFSLDRYPVTVARFRLFMEMGGYDDWEYWDDEGWHWRQTTGITAPRLWDGSNPDIDGMFTTVVGDHLEEFTLPTRPVIGVSLFEAEAFCRFFGRRLPTAAQWEAAARGPTGLPYPWGSHWPKTGITQWGNRGQGRRITAPVDHFPEARGPFGHDALVGNVWQWTTTPWNPALIDGPKTVKGGAWSSPQSQCTTAAQNGFKPGHQWTHLGFRTAGL